MEKLQVEIEKLHDDLKASKLTSSKRILYVAQFEELDMDKMSEGELRKMSINFV